MEKLSRRKFLKLAAASGGTLVAAAVGAVPVAGQKTPEAGVASNPAAPITPEAVPAILQMIEPHNDNKGLAGLKVEKIEPESILSIDKLTGINKTSYLIPGRTLSTPDIATLIVGGTTNDLENHLYVMNNSVWGLIKFPNKNGQGKNMELMHVSSRSVTHGAYYEIVLCFGNELITMRWSPSDPDNQLTEVRWYDAPEGVRFVHSSFDEHDLPVIAAGPAGICAIDQQRNVSCTRTDANANTPNVLDMNTGPLVVALSRTNDGKSTLDTYDRQLSGALHFISRAQLPEAWGAVNTLGDIEYNSERAILGTENYGLCFIDLNLQGGKSRVAGPCLRAEGAVYDQTRQRHPYPSSGPSGQLNFTASISGEGVWAGDMTAGTPVLFQTNGAIPNTDLSNPLAVGLTEDTVWAGYQNRVERLTHSEVKTDKGKVKLNDYYRSFLAMMQNQVSATTSASR